MLSMVEKAVVDKKKWIPADEFWDMVAIIQSLPGVFAVNTALYVGHRIAGKRGAVAAMLGAIIPSIVIILLLATIFREYRDLPVVERIFKGIRPCVVALILAPSLRMIKSAKVTWKTAIIPSIVIILLLATIFREYRDLPVVERIFKGIRPCVVALILAPSLRMIKSAKVTWKTAIIPIAAAFLIWWCKVSPVIVIIAAIAGSLVYAVAIERKTKAKARKEEQP